MLLRKMVLCVTDETDNPVEKRKRGLGRSQLNYSRKREHQIRTKRGEFHLTGMQNLGNYRRTPLSFLRLRGRGKDSASEKQGNSGLLLQSKKRGGILFLSNKVSFTTCVFIVKNGRIPSC